LVVTLCDRILGDAFRPEGDHTFARCGAAQTTAVTRRTVVALLRIRYRLKERRGAELFAEEIVTASFRRTGDQLEWLQTNGEEIISLLKGDIDSAIEEYREALRLNPNNDGVHLLLGIVLELNGDRRGALEEYRAAYMLDPKNADYKQNYERLLQQLNQ
jgi:Flp pilus assembly protein TadD